MSLAGRTVLITRPVALCAPLAEMLRAEGALPVTFPVIDIEPLPDALAALPSAADAADWVIFVSPSAIDCAWPVLGQLAPNVRLACVGVGSANRLRAMSQRAVLCPHNGNDSAALLAEDALHDVAGQRILIVGGVGGRAELGETLKARGARIGHAEIYRRVDATLDWSRIDTLLKQEGLDACIVTSSEIAERFFRLAGSARIPALQCLQYCVPHPRIAERLAALGVARIVTTRAGDAALTAGLKEWFSRHP
jgi:uroporphyrinogen-III synthase